MNSSSPLKPTLAEVFDALRAAAESVATAGGILYGAQAKTDLKRLFPDFTEQDFGYKKFIDFLRVGDADGYYQLEVVGGHPRIHPKDKAVPTQVAEPGRLKPDLWSTIITWDAGKRYWDKKRKRAIFLPTDDTGIPAWETSPNDFVEIDSVAMQEHIAWMHLFASGHSEPVRKKLVEALDSSRPGAFKQALEELGLNGAWRAVLQQRVMAHATAWAARNGLPVTLIVDHYQHPSVIPSVASAAATKPTKATAGLGEIAQLRARLHEIVDEMSLTELSALSIPAAYLLKR